MKISFLRCTEIAKRVETSGILRSHQASFSQSAVYWALLLASALRRPTSCELFILWGSDGFTHRPNRPWPRAPRNSFLWRLITNLKFGKPSRGLTSQLTLKRAEMQRSGNCQYSNNTIILFVTQYKNDNTAFNRSSAVFVSGGLALEFDVTAY